MAQTTPGGLPIPSLSDDANVPDDMMLLGKALDPRTEARFASVADRDATYPASVAGLGARCLITDTRLRYIVWLDSAGTTLAWHQCSADGAIHVADAAARDALLAIEGLVVHRVDLVRLERYHGGAWVVVNHRPRGQLTGTGTQSVGSASHSVVLLDVNDGTHDVTANLTNGRLSPNSPGWFLATGGVGFAGNSTGRRIAAVRKNGVIIDKSQSSMPPAGSLTTIIPTIPTLVQLAAGDYVDLDGYQDSGAILDFLKASCTLSLTYVGRV